MQTTQDKNSALQVLTKNGPNGDDFVDPSEFNADNQGYVPTRFSAYYMMMRTYIQVNVDVNNKDKVISFFTAQFILLNFSCVVSSHNRPRHFTTLFKSGSHFGAIGAFR